MKKIILVNGSPREGGNCDKALELLRAELGGCEVECFCLRDRQVNPCLACNACKAKETASCVQQDDMGSLIACIDNCDAIVVASPVYFGMVTGPAKTFLDRLYAFFAPGKPNRSNASRADRKGAVILTAGGGPAEVYAEHGKAYAGSLGVVGATQTKVLSFNGGNVPGTIFEKEANAAQVRELAAWLAE